jgi:hypothetical protein
MTIVYVTTGAWGSGSGTPNSAAQVDGNFYDVDQRIVALVTDVAEGKRIDTVTYTDVSMTFHFTDSSSQVIPLPVASIEYVGEWTNSTPYTRGHMISAGIGFYQVLESHVTPPIPALFDPNATDETTDQNPLYQLFLEVVGLPTEGEAGQFLRKVTATSYDADWQDVALDDLSDVEVSTAPDAGSVLTFTGGIWTDAAASAGAIDDLTDVSLATSVSSGEILTYDGTDWIDSDVFDPPMSDLGAKTGSFTLALESPQFVKFNMTANCTISSFTWPSSSGQIVRRMIQVVNGGSFTLTWPAAVKWPGGTEPTQTVSGTDVYILFTTDAGTNVYGNIVGQSYS